MMRVVRVAEFERTLTIRGAGFTPGGRVRLTVLGPEPWRADIVAAADGTFLHVEEHTIPVHRGALVFAAEELEFAVGRTIGLAPEVGVPILLDRGGELS